MKYVQKKLRSLTNKSNGDMRLEVEHREKHKPRVCILASNKNSPPALKFFIVFKDFLRSFKLHKGILTCVL